MAVEPGWIGQLAPAAELAGEDISASLELARAYGALLPLPGGGDTARRFAVLTALGEANLTAARVFEAHTDALAILAEADQQDDTTAAMTFGVFASDGPDGRLHAVTDGGGFRLDGVKHWCSLGSVLDAALVTAHVSGGRQLFQVDLRDPSITAESATGWVARGLRTVTSTSLRFDRTPAQPVGDVDWYLTRPGFSWGGIGVSACWYGGALGLRRTMKAAKRPPLDPISALAFGSVDAQLFAAGAVLERAAATIDRGDSNRAEAELLALRVRAVVAEAAEQALRHIGHALGPAPLAFNEEHARRAADLTLYLRQHHGESDLAALGHAVAGGSRR